MSQEYVEKISAATKKMQEPLREIAELNVKTLQSFTYMKPDELSKITKPGDLLEKQIEIVLANGHKALDYMQEAFQIMEKTLLTFAQETKANEKAAGKK